MISKLIVWGSNREEAIARMKRVLFEYKITGVKTSISFLARIMDTPSFKSGKYNTHFIENNKDFLMSFEKDNTLYEDMAIIVSFIDYTSNLNKLQDKIPAKTKLSKWKDFGKRKAVSKFF